MTNDEIDVLLLEADATPHGVLVRTNDPFQLRSRLYPRMKATGVSFRIRIPREPGELYLIKEPKDAAGQA